MSGSLRLVRPPDTAACAAFLSLALLSPISCSRRAPQATPEPVSVTVQAARLDNMRDVIKAPGTVVPAPAGDWTIYAPDSGRIVELPKMEGDTVQPGDLLVRFDLNGVSQDLAARQADVAAATTRVDAAKGELAQQQALFDRGIIPRNRLDAAKAKLATAESSLSAAEAARTASASMADRAVIKARFAGVVSKRWHNEGDVVNAMTNDPVLRVIDPTRVQVAAHVTRADLLRILPGQTATVSAAGVPAGDAASVVMVPAPPQDPSVTTADVRLAFSGPTNLVNDMAVEVEVLVGTRTGVVVVPAASVLRLDGQSLVMIASPDGLAHRRDVKVGLMTADLAEIVSGVTAGDQVIVKGLESVTDGGPITIER